MKDARKYQKTGNFIKKAELQQDGPRLLVIAGTEEQPTYEAKKGKGDEVESHLLFTDGSRLSLRTQDNLNRIIKWFGNDMDAWPGNTVVAYYAPDVSGPNGATGGVRLRLPKTAKAKPEAPYVSDLEQPAAQPAKSNGADKPAAADDDSAF